MRMAFAVHKAAASGYWFIAWQPVGVVACAAYKMQAHFGFGCCAT